MSECAGKIRHRDRIAALLTLASEQRTDGSRRPKLVPLPEVQGLAPHLADQKAEPMTAFAPRWKPWRWCRTPACRLTRHHFGRHGYADGRYFDARGEGTP